MSKEVREIEIQKISVNPYQPRRQFACDEIEELAESIRSVGLIQPPVVRPLDATGEKYELIAGERRYRAAALAGMEKIPVIINRDGGDFSAEMALVENIQRVDLNPLEIARALRRLIVDFGFQQEELAKRIGKKRSTVTNYLRLLSLPHAIQESLQKDEITMGHAKTILSLEGFDQQLVLHAQILEDGLSVRETEEAAVVKEKNPPKRRLQPNGKDCFIKELEEKLEQKLGTKVAIESQGKRGRLTIDYYSLDDLDRIIEAIL